MFRSPFIRAPGYSDRFLIEYRGVQFAGRHSDDAAAELRGAAEAGLFDRSNRGLVVVRGRDRQVWLHNLVTNAIKTLAPDSGCYAFALDAKGRIQFDLNVLCRTETLWLDLDRMAIDGALKHLDLRLITEDVKLEDASDNFARLGISGRRAIEIAALLGAEKLLAIDSPPLAFAELRQPPRTWPNAFGDQWRATCIVRHDFAGDPAFELLLPVGAAHAWWTYFREVAGAVPAGLQTLDVLRIEAGLPWLGRDLDDRVLPAETGQTPRAVNFNKGCYLGQEVVERMRSRGALARRLVRLSTSDGAGLSAPVELRQGEIECGRLTSLAFDARRGLWIGLGYLKTSISNSTGLTAGPAAVTIDSPPQG